MLYRNSLWVLGMFSQTPAIGGLWKPHHYRFFGVFFFFFFYLLVIPNGNVYAFFSLYHNCTFMLAFCVQPIFALIGSSSLYAFLLSEVGFLCVCVLQGKSLQLQMQFQVFCLAAWKRAGLILARAALGCKGLSPWCVCPLLCQKAFSWEGLDKTFWSTEVPRWPWHARWGQECGEDLAHLRSSSLSDCRNEKSKQSLSPSGSVG